MPVAEYCYFRAVSIATIPLLGQPLSLVVPCPPLVLGLFHGVKVSGSRLIRLDRSHLRR
ncbi:hypothetical protein FF011L_53220 [Roseimaritima multifibrata]|uniref:Uncharacterized protein n=1 Tax=Roseimaritima multifibrata TaxID=1930274 RepID=A0A517MNQ8_9BACT|nr:hypothetical protein FF011L_53220 [Roseimaritima multifibrata]